MVELLCESRVHGYGVMDGRRPAGVGPKNDEAGWRMDLTAWRTPIQRERRKDKKSGVGSFKSCWEEDKKVECALLRIAGRKIPGLVYLFCERVEDRREIR